VFKIYKTKLCKFRRESNIAFLCLWCLIVVHYCTFSEHLVLSPFLWWGPCCPSFLFSVLVFLLRLSSACVLCAKCCPCQWIVHSWLLIRFLYRLLYILVHIIKSVLQHCCLLHTFIEDHPWNIPAKFPFKWFMCFSITFDHKVQN